MYLQNIFNKNHFIYLFERLADGKQVISIDKSFYPYYFEPSIDGTFTGYDGKKLKKILTNTPSDVTKNRTENSYESDILFPKRYIIDKIPIFEKTLIKYLFIDIEIMAPELPDISKAEYPISCITIYNSLYKSLQTWFLRDYGIEREYTMLDEVVKYIKYESPDLLLAWNMEFDYVYLHNRIKDFARRISPINEARIGFRHRQIDTSYKNQTFLPAGISIVDYKGLYEKLTLNKKRSYALDYIAQEDLGEASFGNTEFGTLNDIIKEKNINDVNRMVKLEQKFKIITHFDEIRRVARCLWEDLPQEILRQEGRIQKISNNSKIIDMLVLAEAKKMNIILPKKTYGVEKEEFEGAHREQYKAGVFHNVDKCDLSAAYPSMIIDLCLDTANISNESEPNVLPVNVTDRVSREVKCTYFIKQNSNTLLPVVIKKLIDARNISRKLLKEAVPETEEYKELEMKYNAFKSIVLSAWGVLGNQYYRLYDARIAALITSNVRDLLHYVREHAITQGIEILYEDTDSALCIYDETKISNVIDILNDLIQQWSQERFKKTSSIKYDLEGTFEKILLLKKCHYLGYLRTTKGLKKEVKGLEVKRSSSSKYEAKFQDELIEKVLNKETKDQIIDWIKSEIEKIKTLSFVEIGFPSKITNDNYKNEPIFVRACNNSKELFKGFTVNRGELFHYIFIHPIGRDINSKIRDVIAINSTVNIEKNKPLIDINWEKIIDRSIISKTNVIFEVMDWGNIDFLLINQTSLF